MIALVITDKDKKRPTSEQLRKAEDLFDFTVKERRELFGGGNLGLVEAGLCDGQRCIQHKFLPDRRGCYCRLATSKQPPHIRKHYKEMHGTRCSCNGENTTPEFGCNGYKPDYSKEHERARPEYTKIVVGRQVI